MHWTLCTFGGKFMKRVYNFSAGPSVLPEAVLRRAADEMLDYQGSGQSVMEMSHRSKTFDAIIKKMCIRDSHVVKRFVPLNNLSAID